MTSPIDIHDPANHTLEGFRAFFASIDESLWCSGVYANNDGQRCAQGHLCHWTDRISTEGLPILTSGETLEAGRRAFEPLSDREHCFTMGLVNNGLHLSYQQPTPRARILAALDDLILLRDARHLDTVETRALVSFDLPVASLS